MAKEKAKGGPKGMPNRHLHARISFLHQAAAYLAAAPHGRSDAIATSSDRASTSEPLLDKSASAQSSTSRPGLPGGLPCHLSAQLRQITQKAQLRLHQSIKHAFCRTCNSVLVEGHNSRKRIENLSRGSKKPHADVLIIECLACSTAKRFPIGAKRQQRKAVRTTTKNSAATSEPATEGNTSSIVRLDASSSDVKPPMATS